MTTAVRQSRRSVLGQAAAALATAVFPLRRSYAFQATGGQPVRDRPGVRDRLSRGRVIGQPNAEKVGAQILADGGNAFDAVVAAALVAGVAAPHQTGIGGYGGCATLALGNQDRVVSLDFNSAAPLKSTPDMFQLGSDGKPRNNPKYGWLAAGVPGVLAGLQLLLSRYGTLSFSDVVEPAIRLAREGIEVDRGVAAAMQAAQSQLAADPGSRKLYLPDGNPIRAGQRFCNPELAELLTTLSQRNSVDSFYRGDISQRIVAAFAQQGGRLSQQDMSGYKAREVDPLVWKVGDRAVHTAPLTAGGLTVLQALNIFGSSARTKNAPSSKCTHARIEALRLAWRDRLARLGDPDFIQNPTERLLSKEYARECATQIEAAVEGGRILAHTIAARDDGGTISLSAADSHGNFVALTLTHGESFGARITIDGLGLTLGHGMSRFDTDPNHPNAPGPGKRPIHNMCPTIVTRDGRPVLAAGARGGRRIPNALFEVLSQFVFYGKSLADSVAAPRVHTEGNSLLIVEKTWPENELEFLRQVGYRVTVGANATVSAVGVENGTIVAGMR